MHWEDTVVVEDWGGGYCLSLSFYFWTPSSSHTPFRSLADPTHCISKETASHIHGNRLPVKAVLEDEGLCHRGSAGILGRDDIGGELMSGKGQRGTARTPNHLQMRNLS